MAPSYLSFSTNVFLDRKDYEEPMNISENAKDAIIVFSVLAGLLLLALIVCYVRQ